jgi:hypothetical protein
MTLTTRLRHGRLTFTALPGLLTQAQQRDLLAEMRRFSRRLPQTMQESLPEAMQHLTPDTSTAVTRDPDTIRRLADLTALLDRRSPLGLCLRRSLLRYHFLRQAGVPVEVVFGAKFANGGRHADSAITGHAWTMLHGTPYHEVTADYEGFTPMFTWPSSSNP